MTATTILTRLTTAAHRPATALLVLATTTATAWGSPINSSFTLSKTEASRPILLDKNGARIVVAKGPNGTTTMRPSGASPTYVAYRLDKASELPDGFPTIKVGAGTHHSGPAYGPLRLDSLAKTSLDAELAKSGEAAVQLPRQTYVVESLASLLGTTSDAATKIWLASTAASGAHARPAQADGSSLGDTLKGWFNTSTNAIQNLNSQISDAIKRQLQLDAPKPVISPPLKTKTAAQLLEAPGADAAALAQAAPVPEPASLLVFAAAAGAAALRSRIGRKRAH
jgi:hypothetical protein